MGSARRMVKSKDDSLVFTNGTHTALLPIKSVPTALVDERDVLEAGRSDGVMRRHVAAFPLRILHHDLVCRDARHRFAQILAEKKGHTGENIVTYADGLE